MELHHTILGLLRWKSLSGYDLKRIISDSDVFYWSGNNNQIYKTLLELQNEGLVTHQVLVQEGLPAKKIYSIAERGLEELKHSLSKSPELPEFRKPFLIQLAWAELLTDEELLALLANYEAEIADRLIVLQATAEKKESRPRRSKREEYLWAQIDRNLIATYQSELDWVRQTRQAIGAKAYNQ